jgi:plastocyanin
MLAIAIAGLVAALAFAGCGDDKDKAPADQPAGMTDAPAGGTKVAPKGAVRHVTVGLKDKQFDPADVKVKIGEAVEWENRENIPHNVVAKSGADFKSDIFSEGGTFSYTAEKPGTIRYVCTLHPGMDGTITVTG